MSLPSAYSGALKHDPEKCFPGFRERSCSKLARPEHRHWVIKDGAGAFRDFTSNDETAGSSDTLSMIPKSGYRFPAFAKPASAGEGRSEKIMLKQQTQREMAKAISLANALKAIRHR
jgi:hypothetical protein